MPAPFIDGEPGGSIRLRRASPVNRADFAVSITSHKNISEREGRSFLPTAIQLTGAGLAR